MTNDYTRAVLSKAERLSRLETAAALLPGRDLRALFFAALAALMMFFPTLSAAQALL